MGVYEKNRPSNYSIISDIYTEEGQGGDENRPPNNFAK